MKDPRFTQLAELLVRHSTNVQPGERVLVETTDIPTDFTAELIRAIASAGGVPLVLTYHQAIQRALLHNATAEQLEFMTQVDRGRMEQVQAYIALRGAHNISELSDVPREKMDLWERLYVHPVHMDVRVPKTKWCVLRWPTSSMAQGANTSTEAFEDFYFRVCAGVDYARMAEAVKPLVDLMDRTDRARITGPETDLTFSKRDIPTRGCTGEHNIPDGEAFSCPVRDSVNGTVRYNCETLYRGTIFNNIRLAFKDGKVTQASADSAEATRKLEEILSCDEGACYIGEFALGFNPYITKPMKDILFDEKIAGSFHFTPGQAYPVYGNANKSQIHWDMVCIQRPEYGGGEIYFDDVLIRKDGLFVLPALEGLNPDRLGAG